MAIFIDLNEFKTCCQNSFGEVLLDNGNHGCFISLLFNYSGMPVHIIKKSRNLIPEFIVSLYL